MSHLKLVPGRLGRVVSTASPSLWSGPHPSFLDAQRVARLQPNELFLVVGHMQVYRADTEGAMKMVFVVAHGTYGWLNSCWGLPLKGSRR
jgi:hypothetical protein